MTKKLKIILKHSSVEDKTPTPDQLEVGEIALNNFKDKEFLSFKNTDGEIVKISPSGDKQVIEDLQTQVNTNKQDIENVSSSLSTHINDYNSLNSMVGSLDNDVRKFRNYPENPERLWPVNVVDSRFDYAFQQYIGDVIRNVANGNHGNRYIEYAFRNLQEYLYNCLSQEGFLSYYDRNLKTGLSKAFINAMKSNSSDARDAKNDYINGIGQAFIQGISNENSWYTDALSEYTQNYLYNKDQDINIFEQLDNNGYVNKDILQETVKHYATTDTLQKTVKDINSELSTKLDATAYTAPDLTSYAKKSDIPSKTSQLTNDSGYITGVDLSSYDTIEDVNSKLANKLDATAYTSVDLSSYAKKTDIPSKTSQLTNDSGYITGVDLSNYDTIEDVDSKLSTKLDATAYTAVDLSSYAKKTDIPTVPTKTSQLTNDSGFITGVDLSSYDTITDVDSKLSTKLDATAYTSPDLSSYAKKTDIPSKTSQLTNDSGYINQDTLQETVKHYVTTDTLQKTVKDFNSELSTKQDKVNNIVVGKTSSYTLQSVSESEWENLSGSADSNTIYFIK